MVRELISRKYIGNKLFFSLRYTNDNQVNSLFLLLILISKLWNTEAGKLVRKIFETCWTLFWLPRAEATAGYNINMIVRK